MHMTFGELAACRQFFIYSFILIIPDIRAQRHKHALKTYLFMIYERFLRYSHLPHQVANNGINCYDTKLSKYQVFAPTWCILFA